MKRLAVHSMGCRLNLLEGELLSALAPEGYTQVDWREEADVYVLNTCTVTARADMRARGHVRAAYRRNPSARIVVTGCYAQTSPDALAAMPEVWAVIGNHEKASIPTLLAALDAGDPVERVQVSRIWQHRTLDVPLARDYPARSRPFVKIQDGCNEICAFCKIPRARGRNRSSPIARVVEQVAMLAQSGFHEVVLTGVHMGCWGEDLDPPRALPDLVQALLALPAPLRIRLSSIEPQHFTPALADLVASEPRVCPHLHLPLQSGDDGVLARMRRRYDAATYAARVESVAARVPDLCIGADVIAGFPGETDAAHRATLALVRRLPLAYLHVFPFSAREQTPAATLPDQVPPDVKAARCRELGELSEVKWRAYVQRFVGRTLPAVALEADPEHDHASTRFVTAHSAEVRVAGSGYARGRLHDVSVVEAAADELRGLALTGPTSP